MHASALCMCMENRCHVDLETLQQDKSFMATLQHLVLSKPCRCALPCFLGMRCFNSMTLLEVP